MSLKVGQHLMVPAGESAEIITAMASEGIGSGLDDASNLAQKLADQEEEPFAVVEVRRIINPKRGSEE